MGTWHDLDVGRPIAAPLQRCAELLGVDLATIRELAANVEPYLRADGTRIWSLMQLERPAPARGLPPTPGRLPRPPMDPSHRRIGTATVRRELAGACNARFPEGGIMRAVRILTVVAALTAALAIIPVAKADPKVFQSNEQFPVSLTFFDCYGQLVTLEGKFHVVSQIWPTDGGGFHSKAHVNVAGVEGTSPDGTKYRFHDNGQSTFETDSTSLNFEQDLVDRYRLTRQGNTLPNDDLVVRATFHIKVENGVVTEVESTFARECN